LPVSQLQVCLGSSGSCGCSSKGASGNTGSVLQNTVGNMAHSLQVLYDLIALQSREPRLVTVMAQIAYIDQNTTCNDCIGCTGTSGENIFVKQLFLGSKQFLPSVNTISGEVFNGNIQISSQDIYNALAAMPNYLDSAAVQLVVYIEDGLQILNSNVTRGGSTPSDAPTSWQLTPISSCANSKQVVCSHATPLGVYYRCQLPPCT